MVRFHRAKHGGCVHSLRGNCTLPDGCHTRHFDGLGVRVEYETALPCIENHSPDAKVRDHRPAENGFYSGAAFGEEDSILAALAAIPKAIRPRVFLKVG